MKHLILKVNKVRWKILFFGFGVIMMISLKLWSNRIESLGEKYVNEFKVELSGIIEGKIITYANSGLLYVDVKASNQKYYDPRDSFYYYFCIIRGNKADIAIGNINEVEVGDSIVIRGVEKEYFIFRNKVLWRRETIYVTAFPLFYSSLRGKHRIN